MFIFSSNIQTLIFITGIHTIPSGIHFIYHGTGMGARQGFFWRAERGDIAVTSWDPSNEEISVKPQLSDEALLNLRAAVHRGELNFNLGPYPLAQLGTWINISNLISDSVLQRADIPCGTVVYPGDASDARVGIPHLDAVQPYFPGLARVARLSPIDEREKRFREDLPRQPGVSPQDVTKHSMDKSLFLETLVVDFFRGSYEELLGELQLSFLLFMLLFSEPGLEHWKRLVHILCNCEDLLIKKPQVYAAFFRILYEQLNFSPEDFFHTELSYKNFLRPAMSSLFQILNSPRVPEVLLEHRKRLLNFMRKKFDLFDSNIPDESSQYVSSPFTDHRSAGHVFLSDEMYNLVAEDMPVILDSSEAVPSGGKENCENEHVSENRSDVSFGATADASNHTPAHSELILTNPELSKYSWRYPALYTAMLSSGGGELLEDMTMTAVRLIEEARCLEGLPSKETLAAVMEARLFVECEVPLMSSTPT
jgi:A1 cistron-splicing factor AAR2